MKNLLLLAALFIGLLSLSHLQAQTTTPFNRGVNITNWFQSQNARQIQFSQYTRTDFEKIKDLGVDAIRLPINLHAMTDGVPNYTLDPLFLSFLDQVVDWAEALEMYLILDNHTFDPSEATDPNIGNVLNKVWRQMAAHYKDRSDYIMYEVLNEPHGISEALWNSIQLDVVNTIREVDTVHTIVIGGANFNSIGSLAPMPVYEDDNLIYTFHFYEPFIFTHQGATWVEPSLAPLANVPFPYDAVSMPSLPASLRNSWIEDAYNFYPTAGSETAMRLLINQAINFRQSRNVPVYCGELGVFIPNSQQEDRVNWYTTVVDYLEFNQLGWTSWDYKGGFGLFEPGSNELYEHDFNVGLLEAIGFNVPPQTEYVLRPDSVGFSIYSDFVGERITVPSFGNSGDYNTYAEDAPNYGDYCLSWTDANQYEAISFDFIPEKDLSQLVAENYALDMIVRGNTPGTRLDIRFLDTKTGPTDRPWRMRITLDESSVNWDNRWYKLHIPLSQFTEQGAWDNAWFPPEGKFDWGAIDRFEIVDEYGLLSNAVVWFDQIHITNLDTSQVNNANVLALEPVIRPEQLKIYPNPSKGQFTVETVDVFGELEYLILDAIGKEISKGVFRRETQLDLAHLENGIYFFLLRQDQRIVGRKKIVKL